MSEAPDRGEATARLIEKARAGDRAAFEKAVELNLPLVVSVAQRYRGRGAEWDDLVQLGSVGLVKAVMRFDPGRGVRFSSCAVPFVAGEIKRFLRDDGELKVARRYKELAVKLKKAVDEAEKRGDPEPRIGDIAASLGVTNEEAALALEACRPPVSLSAPAFSDGEATLGELIPDSGDMETLVIDRVAAALALDKLEPAEKRVALLRFYRDLTQKETAERLGLTQVKVCRMEANIIKKLRREMGEGG